MTRPVLFCLLLITLQLTQAQLIVRFELSGVPENGEARVGVRGSQSPLSWEKTMYLEREGNLYQGSIEMDSSLAFFEYKYVQESGNGEPTYELDGQENRLGIPAGSRELRLVERWDVMPTYDTASLPLIPPDLLRKDAEILGKALWQLHPGVERYLDSLDYFGNLESLYRSFETPHSYASAYREISKFVATVQCGHTYANPFNQTGFIKNIILGQKDKLPLGLEWLDGHLYITKNATDIPMLEAGTEILGIQGLSTPEVAQRLLSLTKGDGENNAKRYNDLGVIGYDSYEIFDVYFPLEVPPVEGRFTLDIRTPDGTERSVSVTAMTRAQRNRILQERYSGIPKSLDDTWSYSILREEVAYLKLGTFTVWNFRMDWKKYLKNAFREFDKAGARKLIIDIRGNEGGADEVIDELRKYLLKTDCKPRGFEERIRYASVPAELRPYAFTWDQSVLDFGDRVERISDGSFRFSDMPHEDPTYRGSRGAFDGQVYLFTDAANSSATFYLAKFFKACGIGKLVGETTGGSLKGINGGNLFFFRLPHTRVEVDIPIYGQFDDSALNGGISPDIPMPRTVAYIQKAEDGALKRLLERINTP